MKGALKELALTLGDADMPSGLIDGAALLEVIASLDQGIALEFRRTLLVITERQQSIVHVRAVVLIAMLAIVQTPIPPNLISRTD